ncbi:MAG: 4-alpha-glucanotransferase [Thermoflexales bacterium]|nr:4-alpha-glucanotransferase [Thermoflexales bacterium]
MKRERAAGVLLHPTSLPGPDGIGDLGPWAYRWIDFLAATGSSLWQVLPLGPTGYGDSPYQCFSAFAGNPYLVSPQVLLEEGLLTEADLADRPSFPAGRVDYGQVIPWKLTLLDRAFARFQSEPAPSLRAEFADFCSAQAYWLEDFALFMAIKEAHNDGGSWDGWPALLRGRNAPALQEARRTYAEAVQRHAFRQFLFFRQWSALHTYAAEKAITIIGDIPIFVAYDSADLWAHPELFYVDAKGHLTVVAGVPPDLFSPTGQLWGNPLYRWDVHAAAGYAWWVARLRATLQQVDLVRLDHFRGFAAYWEVKAGLPTAEKGRWVKGPGADLMQALQQALSHDHGTSLPIIAEDLGFITPDVAELRDGFGLPGMKVLSFAFGGDPDDIFLPHNYSANYVVYTSTHDNDTARGWYDKASEKERDFCRRYLARDGHDISWDTIRLAWSSVAKWAVTQLQDLLSLGSEARMNFPGRQAGNWNWRMPEDALDEFVRTRFEEMNWIYGRAERALPEEEGLIINS